MSAAAATQADNMPRSLLSLSQLSGETTGTWGLAMSSKLTFTTGAGVPVVAKLDGHLDDDPHTNGEETGSSNLGHDLLQVSNVVGGADESSSTSKEGVGPSGIHNGLLLSLLDGGAREAYITSVLLHRERLSSQGSLVNLQQFLNQSHYLKVLRRYMPPERLI